METIDERVRDDVRAQLTSDPRLPYPDEFAVGYDGYAVTLEGTVGSFAQQRAADARRTPFDGVATLRGVTGVTNTIKVIEGRRP
jgi:osmotically-inducible protein OsmY